MSCENCDSSVRGLQEAYRIAREQAKQKAVDQSRPVAIVLEDSGYKFYDPFYAYQMSMPVKEVISHL
jgi:hypothetical protein